MELKIGDKVTVKKWLNSNDRSYIGDLLTVKFIADGFAWFERHNRYSKNPDKVQLNLNEVELKTVSDNFIAAYDWMKK